MAGAFGRQYHKASTLVALVQPDIDGVEPSTKRVSHGSAKRPNSVDLTASLAGSE
jgi:hypothetical protein